MEYKYSSMEKEELYKMLTERKALLSHLKAEDFLTGILHKALCQYILGCVGIKANTDVSLLTKKDISILTDFIKALSFTVTNVIGKEQASSGGAILSEFNPDTLESLKCPGLYCTGELLDVVGDCGGYNLHWAWTTAYIAGTNICSR